MKLFSKPIENIRKVYNYEKTILVDVHGLQIVLVVFALIMFLINIENYRLEKYAIATVTLLVGIISLLAVFVLNHYKDVYKVARIAVFLFLVFAVPIMFVGANDGFSLLWYLLIPVITLILLGMPFGVPVCIGFGLYTMLFFWTPLRNYLLYDYPHDYLFFYPIFYWGFCLIVVVMDIFYKSYQMRQAENEHDLEKEVLASIAGTQKLMIDSVTAISQMLDEKDGYTQQHSKRVAEYSKLIAQNMPGQTFTPDEISAIYRSALLHDIGKIAVPDAILNKPARLTDEEYAIMKNHTIWGKEILCGLSFLPQADIGASYHHERYDGSGYPYGLKGDELPEIARIISAADALDAMNSNRCYRKHCDKDYIIHEFEKGSGSQFDEKIAGIVIHLIKEGQIVI